MPNVVPSAHEDSPQSYKVVPPSPIARVLPPFPFDRFRKVDFEQSQSGHSPNTQRPINP